MFGFRFEGLSGAEQIADTMHAFFLRANAMHQHVSNGIQIAAK